MDNVQNIYYIKIIPFVKFEERTVNGKTQRVKIYNLTQDEIENMSCKSRAIWDCGDGIFYPAECPLTLRGQDDSANCFDAFLYDELTKEEQNKYDDRAVIIKSLTDKAVDVYGERSKSIFGNFGKRRRRRVKVKKEN